MDFGAFGAWTSLSKIGAENAAEAARAVEAAGLGTIWIGGSPRLAEMRPLLEGSESLVVGTSIVNIWGYDPTDLVAEYAELEADFPGRACVGIGVGHPEATSDYKRPLTNLEAFLDGIDGAAAPIPVDRRIIAALGPKMLAMSSRPCGANWWRADRPAFGSAGSRRRGQSSPLGAARPRGESPRDTAPLEGRRQLSRERPDGGCDG